MNRATKIIVSTFGVLLGISGINHGFFEMLQGNNSTNTLIFESIGVANRMWLYGFETAFTIIPNYLITGFLAILISMMIIVWSVAFVQKKNGSFVLILLFILLFLTGGGMGQVIFFLPLWGVATYINNPLIWWRKNFPGCIQKVFSRIWPFTLTIDSILFLAALEIAVFGIVPGVTDPNYKLFISWSLLVGALLLFAVTFISALANDIQQNNRMSEE